MPPEIHDFLDLAGLQDPPPRNYGWIGTRVVCSSTASVGKLGSGDAFGIGLGDTLEVGEAFADGLG